MRFLMSCFPALFLGLSFAPDAAADDSWVESAEQAQQAGDLVQAAQHFERHLLEHPADTDRRLLYARVLVELGRKAEAFEHVQFCIRGAPQQAPVQLAGGLLLHQMKRYSCADDCFERVRKLKPDDGLVEDFIGRMQADAGRLIHAQAHYQRACADLPDWCAPRVRLGRLWLRLGRPGEALELLEQAVVDFPSEFGAKLALAHALLACRLRPPAVELLRAVVEGAPNEQKELRAEALRLLARLYDEAGLVEPAVACYEAAILESDEAFPILDDLARLYHDQGRVEDGRALLSLAVQLEGRASDRVRLAQVLESMGRLEEALSELETVVSSGACRPELFWTKARLEESLGLVAEAQRSFSSLLAVEGRHPDLADRVEYLWMVAERSLASTIEGVSSGDRGRDYLRRLRARADGLEEEGRAAVAEAARRAGLPAEDVAQGRVPLPKSSSTPATGH